MGYNGEMACVTTSRTIKEYLRDSIQSMTVESCGTPIANYYEFVGTDKEALFEDIPQMRLPCVIVWYRGSEWGNSPRRLSRYSVVVATRAIGSMKSFDEADEKSQGYVEDIVDALNRTIIENTNVEVRIESDSSVAVEKSISAYEIIVACRNQ